MEVLDRLDTEHEPMHVMEGEWVNGDFPYSSDGGLYVGGGELTDGLFRGDYKGPVDGTFRMWRLDNQE